MLVHIVGAKLAYLEGSLVVFVYLWNIHIGCMLQRLTTNEEIMPQTRWATEVELVMANIASGFGYHHARVSDFIVSTLPTSKSSAISVVAILICQVSGH